MDKKINLIFYENSVNRFSISYLICILEQENLQNNFHILFFQNKEQLLKLCLEVDLTLPTIFIFSFMTTLISDVKELVEYIKYLIKNDNLQYNKTLIIAGGPHPNGDPNSTLKLGFDLVFVGEAEKLWVNFLNLIIKHLSKSDFKDKILNEYNTKIIINTFDIDLNKYIPVTTLYSLIPPIEIMRGCFYSCKFCQTGTLKVKFRDFDSIYLYFQEFKKRNYKRLSFICPSAFQYKATSPSKLTISEVEKILSIAKTEFNIKFVEYGIFPSESRPETINDETVYLIKKYCSNKKLSIGAQSGYNDRIFELRRGHSFETILNACEILKKYNLGAVVDFIFGFPDETEEEQIITLNAIKNLHKKFGVHIQTHYFIPLPGTPYYNKKPTQLFVKSIKLLEKFSIGGICTNWYKEGIMLSEKVCKTLNELLN